MFDIGDEVLEWNGHPLVNKSYDDVRDLVSDSRHDSQVELRVARSLTTPVVVSGAAASGAAVAGLTGPGGSMGRPPGGPGGPAAGAPGIGGGRIGAPPGTRIQVGKNSLRLLFKFKHIFKIKLRMPLPTKTEFCCLYLPARIEKSDILSPFCHH